MGIVGSDSKVFTSGKKWSILCTRCLVTEIRSLIDCSLGPPYNKNASNKVNSSILKVPLDANCKVHRIQERAVGETSLKTLEFFGIFEFFGLCH